MPNGLSIRSNSKKIPILRLHYSAHPQRDAAWVAEEKPKYSEAMWQQEQEIDYSAAGGERVLRALLERRWEEIVITDPKWEADPGWAYGNGLDYGKAHPCAFEPCAMDFTGCRYALAESYHSGLTPKENMAHIKTMRLPCVEENGANPLAIMKALGTFCDPSMGYTNVASEDKFTSYTALFASAGMPRVQLGIRGHDQNLLAQIIDAWNQPDPMFKIVCRNMPFPCDPGSMKKREGTYEQGCPNLLWELLNLRRNENTAVREEKVGPSEGLVDKDNDGWDALKYWWTSQTATPQISENVAWRQQVHKIREKHPDMDLNSLSMHQQRWERERKRKREAVLSWR